MSRIWIACCAVALSGLASSAGAVPIPIGPPLPAGSGDGLNSLWVQVDVANKPDTIAEALAVLAAGSGGPGFIAAFSPQVDVINFGGNVAVPQFGGTPPVVNNPVDLANGPGSDPRFAVHYFGFLNITTAGNYLFGAGHDDGVRLTVGGEVLIDFPFNTPPVGTFSPVVFLGLGIYDLSYVSWEQGGQFLNQLVWQGPGIPFGLVPEGSLFSVVPEPSTVVLLGLGLAACALRVRSVRARN